MDNRRQNQTASSRQRLQGRQSSPALQQSPLPSRRAPEPYSSPLPQTQWADVPLPYRPRDWAEPEDGLCQPNHTDLSAAWYCQPPPVHDAPRSRQQPRSSKNRRRPRGIRDLFGRAQDEAQDEVYEQPVDVSLLYPQMNPYHDRLSMHSAPDELEHFHARSLSQPNTPGYMNPTSAYEEPQLTSMPRSPTYPPAGRSRMDSSTGVGEAAFDDEEEFRLFAEATAGLGPEQAFRHGHTVSSSDSARRRLRQDPMPLNRAATTASIVSPLDETPTTMHALQQLPQMPEGHRQGQLHRERMQNATSSLDLWLQAHIAEADIPDISPLEESVDDELPDYASSQAQAQANQRAEAARRAQELQRRWQLSGSRRGLTNDN